MSNAVVETEISKFAGCGFRSCTERLAVEEPLEIRLGKGRHHRAVSITMRTPGADAELAAGFLFTEGLLQNPAQIKGIRHCGRFPNRENTVRVELHETVETDFARLRRNFYMTSSCGVCGKSSLNALEVAGAEAVGPTPDVAPETVSAMPERLLAAQAVFGETGGLHAAGLFDPDGRLLDHAEDVGRHNAVDKLIGRAFLEGRLPLSGSVLFLSGRASFELVQKAVMARIPFVCAVGAPSSLAVDAARRFSVRLVGFVRGGRFNVYSEPGTRG